MKYKDILETDYVLRFLIYMWMLVIVMIMFMILLRFLLYKLFC